MMTLANAKVIKAESMNKGALNAEVDKDGLSYYLSRHEAKVHRPSGNSISRKANLVYASYNSRIR
jgi:hypothetical protein